jgi:hypothetical protein
VEDARQAWARDAKQSLRDPKRFDSLRCVIDNLGPLKLETLADREGQDHEYVAAAKARDRLRVWRSVWFGLNDRELKHAMLASAWWPKRDRAISGVEKALLRLCDVLNESQADPGLLGLSFEPVLRAFHEFKNPNREAFGGRGNVLQTLVVGTPKSLRWSRGGRFAATWLSRTASELHEWGVRGEATQDVLDAAGLTGSSPMPKGPRSRRRTR